MGVFNAWERIGLPVVFVAGSLLHFVYGWTGRRKAVGLFSPVNESTWEHLKLLFFPGLVYLWAEYLAAGYRIPGFLAAKTVGLLLGMLAIVCLFYTYTGIIGRNFLPADILTFGIGTGVAFAVSRSILNGGGGGAALADPVAIGLLGLWLLLFFLFTYCPPRIAVFRDPVDGSFGLS